VQRGPARRAFTQTIQPLRAIFRLNEGDDLLLQSAEDRTSWSTIINEAANPRTEENKTRQVMQQKF